MILEEREEREHIVNESVGVTNMGTRKVCQKEVVFNTTKNYQEENFNIFSLKMKLLIVAMRIITPIISHSHKSQNQITRSVHKKCQ